ncbi:helix-turn-helix domain-containing protein [Pedobacter nutrimenti]|jgi:transcriptional regulator with XRE-family HTH domain|uniref:Transcriptional regulator with XRE-family HTH domain n=1 Tax=Pedobacter nutrimenti TaxID=1241337 RepID=A0A318UZZ0_9SPHI|nr:helix-turn-helix transcriptional regulator [Pedobacter nutrimenti]PYF77169.1 transcriptional regulator with XRE-family HTH domain [Pedobacter nutrimenti]|eukprot:gene17863-21297_t
MIGEKIRERREHKKISQYAVAYAIGMSQAAYSKIERGETEVKVSHLYSIAAFLGTSVYELLPEAMASSTFDGEEYLLKPLVVKLKTLWFTWKVRRRIKKMPKTLES